MRSIMRRRAAATTTEASELEEPLLGAHGHANANASAGRAPGSDNRPERAVVPHSINAYDWANLLRSLVAGAAQGLRTLQATLRNCLCWWPIGPKPSYTVSQLAGLAHLRQRMSVPYNPECQQHQAALKKLWGVAFPGEQFISFKTERWKDMGWQGTDPATDFRGAGFLALECHLYMASRHPLLFQNLRYKRSGSRSEWEYPFAAGGVNLCFAILELLDIRDASRMPRTLAGQAFIRLLGQRRPQSSEDRRRCLAQEASGAVSDTASLQQQASSRAPQLDSQTWQSDQHRGDRQQGPLTDQFEEAFEEVYCAAYAALDRHWLVAKATYMDFPSVMRDTKGDVQAALAAAAGSLDLATALLSGKH